METLCAVLFFAAIMMNSTGLSSASERLPDGGHHTASPEPSAESTARSRSRSPTIRHTFCNVLGFRFEDLEFIRLSPYTCPELVFELRRYVFPPDKPIGLSKNNRTLDPMPTREQIVLSTPNGDACAILDKTLWRLTILRAMFTLVSGLPRRAKMNMNSGEVKALTAGEIEACPVSTREQIARRYSIFRACTGNTHTGSSSPCSSSLSTPLPTSARSPTLAKPLLLDRSKYYDLWKTHPNILGYRFEDLEFIRLIPNNYPHRIFQFRIYVFPPDKPIGLKTKQGIQNSMPSGDQIVLSTSNGDVCAILLKSSNKSTSLRPIWTSILGKPDRVKINMSSGVVQQLTEQEIAECPGTCGNLITKTYRVSSVSTRTP